MALNQVGTLLGNVHSPSGTIKLRLSEFSYLETQPGSSSTRPLKLNDFYVISLIVKIAKEITTVSFTADKITCL